MSAEKIDVLAVMRKAVSAMHGETDAPDARRYAYFLHDARVAVADLIEAGNRVVRAFHAYGRAGGVVDNARAHQECVAAMVALKEALARIGGDA
jgi:hypothetical protein